MFEFIKSERLELHVVDSPVAVVVFVDDEFDDFLIEYAAIRLSVGNEYDMTQESQLLANIYAQIQTLLTPPPPGIITKGYWQ